jgi:hypothetical protein
VGGIPPGRINMIPYSETCSGRLLARLVPVRVPSAALESTEMLTAVLRARLIPDGRQSNEALPPEASDNVLRLAVDDIRDELVRRAAP